MIKKIIIISPILLTILLVVFFLFIGRSIEKKPSSFPKPTSVPIDQPTLRKIEISGIKTNDFISRPTDLNRDGDVLFLKTSNYEAVYLKKYNQFLLNISSSSVEIINQAEEEFLKKLGISKKDACRLDVIVNSPYVPNPNLSMPRKTLSFCINY